jgi:hypothetical protein
MIQLISYKPHLSSVKDVQELLAGSSLGNRLLDGSLSVLSDELLSSEGLGVRVESEKDGLVSERVLLLGEGSWLSARVKAQLLRAWKCNEEGSMPG